MTPITNIEVLGKSRPPRIGDIFAFRVRGVGYLFGRVAATDALVFEGAPMVLIYVYRHVQPTYEPIPSLSPSDLLLPPLIINRLPWSRGYFKTVANAAMKPDDRLPQHCFWDHHIDACFDEYRRPVARTEPCGRVGLHSY